MNPSKTTHFYGRRMGRMHQTRRRALVDILPLYHSQPTPDFFKKSVWLEIGFGRGDNLQAQMLAYPEKNFIGIEPFLPGIASMAKFAVDHDISPEHLFLSSQPVQEILPTLPPHCLERVFILFPDPWPKERHHRRRLVTPAFLQHLVSYLEPTASVTLASDHAAYFEQIRNSIPGTIHEEGYLTPTERPDHWPMTQFEAKGHKAGRPCQYVVWKP